MQKLELLCTGAHLRLTMQLQSKKISLYLYTLTALQLITTAVCDPSAPINCEPPFLRSRTTDVNICSFLYQQFEDVLLTPMNLYRLRQVFVPIDRVDPIVVLLSYNVTFTNYNHSTSPCQSATNLDESSQAEDRMLVNGTISRDFVWTSSVTLSFIDPQTFDFFQPAIFTLLNPLVGPYIGENPNQVFIPLTVETGLPCVPAVGQVVDVLKDITSKVLFL